LEQGNAVEIPSGTYLHDPVLKDALNDAGDVTVQFWVNQQTASANIAWLFSDLDVAKGTGMGIAILRGPRRCST